VNRTLIVCTLITGLSFAGEPASDARPTSEPEIAAALERGNAIRAQDEINPAVLQKCAMILKRKDVRCGHIYMSITGARGEGGGTYRFAMQLKAAAVRDDKALVILQDGNLLLDKDLGLVNGEMRVRTDWNKRDGTAGLLTLKVFNFKVADDTLTCEISEQGAADLELKKSGEEKIPLKTFRPIPSEVLIGLPAFAAKKGELNPGTTKPICVPTIELTWQTKSIEIKPAWISFLSLQDAPLPAGSAIADAASRVRIRYLTGKMSGDGLRVQVPSVEDWTRYATYTLDARQRVVGWPVPGDASLVMEPVDAAKLNPTEPFDFEKILTAFEK
jgi:hypothetical protein